MAAAQDRVPSRPAQEPIPRRPGRRKGGRNRPRDVIEAEREQKLAKRRLGAAVKVYVPVGLTPRPCGHCGAEFLSKMPATLARFCSRRCCGLHRLAKQPYAHRCIVCDTEFRSGQHKATCCSQECVAENARRLRAAQLALLPPPESSADRDRRYGYLRRAISRSAVAEKFRAAEIFERDRWRCGLCGERVRRKRKWPHPESASLDHIVPISEGGQHVRANVQLAHFRCNGRKGAGAGGQMRLFG